MTRPHKLQALRPLIALAVEAAPSLPPSQRADIYEGIALAIGSLDPEASSQAATIARNLRDAEVQQLTFAGLFRP
jgi:hypothetical protein